MKDAGSPFGPRFGLQAKPPQQAHRIRCEFLASPCAGMTMVIKAPVKLRPSSRRRPGSSGFRRVPEKIPNREPKLMHSRINSNPVPLLQKSSGQQWACAGMMFEKPLNPKPSPRRRVRQGISNACVAPAEAVWLASQTVARRGIQCRCLNNSDQVSARLFCSLAC